MRRSIWSYTTSAFVWTLFLGGMAVLWPVVGPATMGGTVSMVVTRGISMEPMFHQGDLVVVADRRREYATPGDMVLYHSAATDQLVLHRIVATTGTGFVTRGDNNWWVDPDLPTQDEIIGEYWFHVPDGGAAVQQLRSPLGLAVFAGLFGVLLAFSLPGIAAPDPYPDDD